MARREDTQEQVRIHVAQRAAKLIAEGQDDYHAAKLKAARELGLHAKAALPDNHEIEAALREHHALFGGDLQPQALAALRAVALRVMEWLERAGFEPWISGAVLNGTANEFSAIELEIVNVDIKQFDLFLLNARVPLDLTTEGVAILRYSFEYEDAPVTVTVFEDHASRQAARSRTDVRHPRARRADAATQFDALGR
jgi:hypothetical protein